MSALPKLLLSHCAKTRVFCTIVNKDGSIHYFGQNWCLNPQETCPREPGEGYEKCDTVCQQVGHAEVVAALNAGPLAWGGVAYITGHTRVCDPCRRALNWVGITDIRFSEPPPWPDGAP